MNTQHMIPSPTKDHDEERADQLHATSSPRGLYSEEKMIVYKEVDPAIRGISMDWPASLGPCLGKKQVKGLGWKATPFIFVAEFGERLGAYGLQINLITYLLFQMNMGTAQAANLVTNFFGATCMAPLAGAILADAYVGRYLITAFGSIIYLVGLLVLTIAAIDPNLRPQACTKEQWFMGQCQKPSAVHMAVLYLSLLIQCIGSGGIRPCTAPFGAEQFESSSARHKTQLRHFFNWYYLTIAFSILLSFTLVVYIETSLGFGYGFGFCALVMGLGALVFVAGTPLYKILPPAGSPITSLVQVTAACCRKRRLPLPDASDLYDGAPGKEGPETILHTDNFRFLDRAAAIDDRDAADMAARGRYDAWRVCTVHQVEELKVLMRMVPVWACAVVMATVLVQQGTFSVVQAISMDRRVRVGGLSLEVPPASMAAVSMLALVAFLPAYDLWLIPVLARYTGHPKGLSYLQRIGAGLVLSVLSMMSAALIETKRRDHAHRSNHVDLQPGEFLRFSAFWLVPQFVLIGLADGLMIVGQLEFFYDEAPASVRSMSNAFLGAALGVGSFLSSAFVSITQSATASRHNRGWLQDNINRGHLDRFYWFLTIFSGLNVLVFLAVSHWHLRNFSMINRQVHFFFLSCHW
ncbi:protein MpNPF30 [Marchantia polymorpha subsp. ruderalis]|uniref:Uncharacterized protein n=2 Tax=Marchantia polymorpha TaxID=3197 RepID=A0AAF6BQF8_MARPO|nr:hypothetical protein MARPO_0016s0045 [Marchantia polymorpha]BBN14242.1 hypothetical protein Mp_6g10020 [Marchantia polymorpha subsp. ruderalis]|eukprot:PTQ44978.1 hypothetical protein MARPO_0016s0045 [Marchantia polymorpha]